MNLFFFMQNSVSLGLHGAAFYFFTDAQDQFNHGPHFSASFYVTGIGMAAGICNLLGMMLYNMVAKRWHYHTILIGSNIFLCFIHALNCIVFARWNLLVGIPDEVFMLCSSALQSVVAQFCWLPATVLLAQMVPDGLESSLYALLAGSANLATGIANYFGAFILEQLGVSPSGRNNESAMFEHFWIAALLASVAPLLPLLFIRRLIPDAYQTDVILVSCRHSATTGSLYERWFGPPQYMKVVPEDDIELRVASTDSFQSREALV